jgi:hypothetical protein
LLEKILNNFSFQSKIKNTNFGIIIKNFELEFEDQISQTVLNMEKGIFHTFE